MSTQEKNQGRASGKGGEGCCRPSAKKAKYTARGVTSVINSREKRGKNKGRGGEKIKGRRNGHHLGTPLSGWRKVKKEFRETKKSSLKERVKEHKAAFSGTPFSSVPEAGGRGVKKEQSGKGSKGREGWQPAVRPPPTREVKDV